MPPLPPKPEVPPIVTQALVAATLSTSACAPTPPRIGQPPPVRIGAEEPPWDEPCVELSLVDGQGAPVVGAEVVSSTGQSFMSDADGHAHVPGGQIRINHPGFAEQVVTVTCGGQKVTLQPEVPPPVRIGPEPVPNP